jgi:hypothetical protein
LTGLTPELSLTVACIRGALQQPTASPAEAAAVDWDRWLSDCGRYGVIPLVHAGLPMLPVEPPERIRQAVHTGAAQCALRHKVWFEPALRDTLGLLQEVQLDPIVLKGSALAYLAYRRPSHRTLVDIDLLFSAEDLDRAADCLLQHGYRRVESEVPEGHHHIPPFLTPNGQFTIELHHHVLPEANPYAINLTKLTARTQQTMLGDIEARVLRPVDTLLHLCVHLAYGHRYQWYPLRTFTDILALTVSATESLDWDELVHTVRCTRTAGAVYWPLHLSQHWLGAPVPEIVLRQLAPPTPARRLIEQVIESPYVLDDQIALDRGTTVLYNLMLELSLYGGCSPSAQVGAIFNTLFPPRHAINHLPADLTQSHLRYAAHWWNPPRLARGALAFGRLVTRRSNPTTNGHHTPAEGSQTQQAVSLRAKPLGRPPAVSVSESPRPAETGG